MKLARYTLRALLFAVALLASLVVPSPAASAASAYDDTYRTAPTIALGNDGWPPYYTECAREDYTASWTSAMLAAPQMTTPYANSFNEALENGRWGVSGIVTTVYGHTVEGFIVYWTEDTSLQLDWAEAYDGHIIGASGGASFHSVLVRNHNAQTVGSDCSPHAILGGGSMVSMSTDTVGTSDDVRNLFVHTDHPNYPTGYEGTPVRTEPPAAKYVAMGDSFSSGEGNAPFEYGTDTSSNTCHRSPMSFPRLLQNDLELGTTAFVACSGAVSDYIINEYNQENVELPQAAFVSSETQLVTITIGGNDVGFGDVLNTCTLPTTEEGTTEEKHQIEHDACVQAIEDARTIATSNALQTKLEDVFSGVRSLGSQDLQVVVAGYPNLFPAFGGITGTCVWGNGYIGTSGHTVASDEVQKARLLHDELNATIAAAVTAAGDSHVHYVDPSSAFSGHELCRPTPWFYNVIPDAVDVVNRKGSYHPNASGQTAYAGVIEGMVNSFS